MNEEKYNFFNPHPVETRTYSYRDMLDCWIAGRENLVRHGIGDGDKPDFSSWMKQFFSSKSEKPKSEIKTYLSICPECETDAFDGYICHSCGMKNI